MHRQVAVQIIYRILLTLAYTSCMLQWLWLAIIAIPPLLESGSLDSLIVQPNQSQTVSLPTIESSPLLLLTIGLITAIVLTVSVIVLVRIPKVIVESGEYLIRRSTSTAMPLITHRKKLPAKRQKTLSRRIRLTIQLLLVLFPLLICMLLPAYKEISQSIIIMIALWLAFVSAASFLTAWALETKRVTSSTSQTQSRASRG
jgi:hypothetical protein